MKISEKIEKNKGIVVVLLIILALLFMGSSGDSSFNYGSRDLTMSSNQYDSGMMKSMPEMAGDSYNVEYASGEKIRKTSSLNLEVDKSNYEITKTKIDDLIKNGLYTNKNEYRSNVGSREYKTYSITIKVPVDQYGDVLSKLKDFGEVKYFSESSDDLTTQYKDIEAYLDSYQKAKVRTEELLNKAESVEDIIIIENKLFELQRNIDNYQRQLTNMNRQVDYGTIYFTMSEKVSASQIALQWTGLMDHLRNIVHGLDSVLVFLTSNLGWFVFLLLIYFVYKLFK